MLSWVKLATCYSVASFTYVLKVIWYCGAHPIHLIFHLNGLSISPLDQKEKEKKRGGSPKSRYASNLRPCGFSCKLWSFYFDIYLRPALDQTTIHLHSKSHVWKFRKSPESGSVNGSKKKKKNNGMYLQRILIFPQCTCYHF